RGLDGLRQRRLQKLFLNLQPFRRLRQAGQCFANIVTGNLHVLQRERLHRLWHLACGFWRWRCLRLGTFRHHWFGHRCLERRVGRQVPFALLRGAPGLPLRFQFPFLQHFEPLQQALNHLVVLDLGVKSFLVHQLRQQPRDLLPLRFRRLRRLGQINQLPRYGGSSRFARRNTHTWRLLNPTRFISFSRRNARARRRRRWCWSRPWLTSLASVCG